MKRFSLEIVLSVFGLILIAGAIYFDLHPLKTTNVLSAEKVIPTKIHPSDTQTPTFTPPTDTSTSPPTQLPQQSNNQEDDKTIMLVGLNNCLNNAHGFYISQMNQKKAQGFYDDPDLADKTQKLLDYQYNQLQKECFNLYRPK